MPDALADRVSAALGTAYRLGPELGRGGMGVVYRATDTRLKREVAVKVLPPDLAFRHELRDRFVREAQLAGGLNHPHIVPIFDVGSANEIVWYVMALVDGETVRGRVQRDGPLTSAQTRRILREVAWALAYAHARGIVHRDIKPDNIMIDRGTGRAVVTDFGIAKIAEAEAVAAETAPGLVMGSPMYMAPEQAAGDYDVDGRADIYALGLSSYYMLSGRPPFDRPSILHVAARLATGATPSWDAIEQAVDPRLRDLLERCVVPDPDRRWQSAEHVLEALGPEALAPRPVPASVRRIVRDFMLFPTFGFIVLVTDVVNDESSVAQMLWWMTLILTVNFTVTLRAFTRRGFGWPDLRDALENELSRHAEELAETGSIKQRFSAIIYLSTVVFGVITGTVGLVLLDASRLWDVSIPVVVRAAVGAIGGGLLGLAVAWIQVRIFTFFGRLLLKLMPSLPRPESEGWLSRLADRVLTRLFRPLRPEEAGALDSAPAWDPSEVATARRTTHSIDELVTQLPEAERAVARPARQAARELTTLVEAYRRERTQLEHTRERELDQLTSEARRASVDLENLNAALGRVANGSAGPPALEAAIDRARETLVAAGHTRPAVSRPSSMRELAANIHARWEQRDDLREALPDALDTMQHLTTHLGRLEGEQTLRRQRGRPSDSSVDQSLARAEAALDDLIAALDTYDRGSERDTSAIEHTMARVRKLVSGPEEE